MDKKTNHKRVIIIAGILLVILITVLIFSKSINNMTTASVIAQTKCVDAKTALEYINEKGCERIYEDIKCAEKGLVEIKC